MGILLFLVGLLATGSGALKILRGYATGDRRVPAVLEIVVGVAVILGSGFGLARARPLAWTAVAAAAAAIAVSSIAHVRASLRDRNRRAASEEARFRRFVEGRGSGAVRGPRP